MRTLVRSIVVLAVLTLITGVAYPLVVAGVGQFAFPREANGSIVVRNGECVGSSLIGQSFVDPRHFWSRPSATSPVPYTAFDAAAATGSGGSNLAPTNPELVEHVKRRLEALAAADAAVGVDRQPGERVPIDLVTASGSGLDPHISPAAALYQVPRVAKARRMDESLVRSLVAQHTRSRQLGVLGDPVVNVLELNLALDEAPAGAAPATERKRP
ncbi:MAG: potassium-transporting ATPase subunit KdpC [Phycisphaerales bacterium]